MLYYYTSIAYTVINLLLAVILVAKSPRSVLMRFYAFCVFCLVALALSTVALRGGLDAGLHTLVKALAVFLFSLIPFFFMHFVVIFLRRYDILKSKSVIAAIYVAGLFGYAIVLSGYLPEPLETAGGIPVGSYIFFITWMSIFFSIGVTLLYSHVRGFSERKLKSNMLLPGFGLLLLVLPSPFTYSLTSLLFPDNLELYGISSTFALLIAVYLLFRHKILITLYDSMKAALAVMNDLFLMTDERFTIEVARGGLVPLLGVSDTALIGRPLNDFLEQKEYISTYLKYVESGKMRECLFDADVRDAQGNIMTINFSFSPVFENDQVAGFVGMGRNITERKRAEEENRLLASALESASDLICITDPNDRFIYANTAFLRTYGYTLAGLLGQEPSILSSPNNPAGQQEELLQATRAGGWSGEILNIKRDGTEFPVFLSTAQIRDVNGAVAGFVGVARDFTEQKKLEEHLLQSQKLESIGTLAGGIAHDFNNILAIIMAYASTLHRAQTDPQRFLQTINAITDSVERGAGIVRELLTIAQKTEIRQEVVDLNASIKSFTHLLKETFPRTIVFDLLLSPELPKIVADQSQVQQSLLNLCVNARDAMPGGGILAIKTGVVQSADVHNRFPDAAGEYVHVSVTDTGTGIPPAVRAHIFEPFFTTKEKGKGTGLGLSVVHSTVMGHHGFIDVDSAPGEGTTFHLYLPITPLPEAEPVSLPGAGSEAVVGGSEAVLVVEDEEMLLDLLKCQLEGNGYSVLTAHDGEEAVEVYARNKETIALVISDVGLPKLGGWESFQRMRVLRPDVRVLFASGYLEPQIQADMTRDGARGFLNKPYSPDEVLRKIREVLNEG